MRVAKFLVSISWLQACVAFVPLQSPLLVQQPCRNVLRLNSGALQSPLLVQRRSCRNVLRLNSVEESSTSTSSTTSSSQERMKEKLKAESKYPFFFPLLAASAVVGGKGLTDAAITLIKVSIGFKGASLSEEFLGLPVLGIDGACVVVGVALATWTWQTQRD